MKPRNVLGCLLNPVLMITSFEIHRGSNRFGRKEFSQFEVFLIYLLVMTGLLPVYSETFSPVSFLEQILCLKFGSNISLDCQGGITMKNF